MANEPERPVESWLRRSAKKRSEQAGAPFELHPAGRRLLQQEVARQFPPAARHSEPFWTLFWPRFAVAALGVLLLSVVVFSLLSPGRKSEQTLLARNEVPRDAAETQSPVAADVEKEQPAAMPTAPAPAPVLPPVAEEGVVQRRVAPKVGAPYAPVARDSSNQPATIGLESSSTVTASAGRFKEELAVESDALRPAAPGPTAPAGATDNKALPNAQTFAGGGGVTSRSVPVDQASTLPAAAAAAPTRAFSFSGARAGGYNDVTQDFVRAKDTDAAKSKLSTTVSAEGVLAAFRLQQSGNDLRVIDRDGSVYTGTLQPVIRQSVAWNRQPNVLKAPKANPAPQTTVPVPSAYLFQLAGTNRSLNKRVVFTGTLTPTNLTDFSSSTKGGTVSAVPALPLSNSWLSGKVQIGESDSIQIDAIPARP